MMRTRTKQLEIGMIWFMGGVDTRKSVEDAARYYEDKYLVIPDECHAHPNMLESIRTVAGIKCVPDTSIQPNFLWIGKR